MRYPPIHLDGASVIVTGGARGIGRAVVERLADQGARVAIGDLDVDAAQQLATAVGGTARRLDVADRDSFADLVDTAEAVHGPIDVLVNNAGIMPNGGFLDLSEQSDRATMEINLFGVVHGMRLVLPGMVSRRRGHVVNLASLAGKFPVPGLAMYNASKFAVVGLTAATRLEMAEHGVSVSAVLPSAVDTPLASGLDMKPIPKVGADDVAAAVVDSVANRRGEIAVPGYVGSLAGAASITPEPVLRTIRRVFRGDRALRPDDPEREAYRRDLAAAAENAKDVR